MYDTTLYVKILAINHVLHWCHIALSVGVSRVAVPIIAQKKLGKHFVHSLVNHLYMS